MKYSWLLSISLCSFFVFFVLADERDHKYKVGDVIPMYVNKIGPYSNPSETYGFYSLPFCQPPAEKRRANRKMSLGEALEGDTYENSIYSVPFREDIAETSVCEVTVSLQGVEQFKKAISNYYYFEMDYDDLPMRGFIGTMNRNEEGETSGEKRYFLFNHLIFTMLYNGDRVIGANVTADLSKVHELKDEETKISFAYTVKWHPTDVSFEQRLTLLTEHFFSAGEFEIHWLSIMNSFVLVIVLTGFIAIIILRVLKSDYSRYNKEDEDEEQSGEDYGWKLISSEVFRKPNHLMLLCASVGNGTQFLLLSALLLVLAAVGIFYPGNEQNIRTAAIVIYALTAGVSGYVSSSFYKKLEGEYWAWTIILTAGLFAIPFFTCAGILNFIANRWDSTTEIGAGAVTIVVTIWLFVGFPLTVLGGITGKRLAGPFEAPTRTKHIPREIPAIPWYRQAPCQIIMAGFLPFSAIYIELYYIYASVWGHAHYTLYGILLLVFIILIIVTACITIAMTYFQLSMEDHHWWWRSFFSGGSTGFFVYAYSIFWYKYRSRMSGLLQGSFFFGYMAMVCYFFFLMLGTVGWYSSLVFIKQIYQNLKCD